MDVLGVRVYSGYMAEQTMYVNFTTSDGELLHRIPLAIDTEVRTSEAQHAFSSREVLVAAEEAVHIILSRVAAS